MMVDDEQIYRDMCGATSEEDLIKVQRVSPAWANALDKLDGANDIRTVFLTCIHAIETMGPAYCKIAAINLMQAAKEAGHG